MRPFCLDSFDYQHSMPQQQQCPVGLQGAEYPSLSLALSLSVSVSLSHRIRRPTIALALADPN